MSKPNFQRYTRRIIRDLHARESMRLGWYRQVHSGGDRIRLLRERKAQHTAFLMDLLRRRRLGPAWYARWFYYFGHLFGWCTALLPARLALRIEHTLEWWIMLRYEKYLRRLKLDANFRSMIEALEMEKLAHNEPSPDVLNTLEGFLKNQEQLLQYPPLNPKA
ncbi:MAG: demethoxyubiquinone hydroxylase family protein [Bacteroidetes bacterium]|nr:demethoxyubiquinone hydroxylase family protein [Bacteroidota bacterium]